MKVRITTTEVADRDIGDIVQYISIDNPAAARQFGDELLRLFETIRDNPDLGHFVGGFEEALRSIRVSSTFWRYRIFYRRASPDEIEIVRILHGSRDVTRLLE
jgi:plasmid stabilization system protein ParE